MVITVEPGIYIPEENIGVRIEDDVLTAHQAATNSSLRDSRARPMRLKKSWPKVKPNAKKQWPLIAPE